MKNTSEDKNKIEQGKIESHLKPNELNLSPQAISLLANAVDMFKEHIIKKEVSEKNEKKSNRLSSWRITLVTLVATLVGVGAGMYQFSVENITKRKFQNQQEIQIQIRQNIQSLEIQIREKIAKRDDLNNAMSKARNLLEVNHLYCKEGKFSGDEIKHGEKQLDVLYQIVNAAYSVNSIFDQNVFEQSRSFLMLFDKNRETCNIKDNFYIKLSLLQKKINELMNNAIFLDKQKKDALLNKLADSPPWKE